MSSILLQGRHCPGSHVGTLPALRQGWFGLNLSIPPCSFLQLAGGGLLCINKYRVVFMLLYLCISGRLPGPSLSLSKQRETGCCAECI